MRYAQIVSVSGYSLFGINEELQEWAKEGWRVIGIGDFQRQGDIVKGLILVEMEVDDEKGE